MMISGRYAMRPICHAADIPAFLLEQKRLVRCDKVKGDNILITRKTGVY